MLLDAQRSWGFSVGIPPVIVPRARFYTYRIWERGVVFVPTLTHLELEWVKGQRERQMEQYIVSKAFPTVWYIPNFITAEEADALWRHVYAVPGSKWTTLSHRRLQNWGGTPHPKGMLVEKLPPWLEDCSTRIAKLGVFGENRPNHVLINEYTAGQGIMPHEDGPLYSPVVSTISLGSHTLLDFYSPVPPDGGGASLESRYLLSLLLEPNSLLILQEDMYTKYLHGIAMAREEDIITERVVNLDRLGELVGLGSVLKRSTRVSLTLRHVPKTIKIKLKLGK